MYSINVVNEYVTSEENWNITVMQGKSNCADNYNIELLVYSFKSETDWKGSNSEGKDDLNRFVTLKKWLCFCLLSCYYYGATLLLTHETLK